MAEKAKAQQQAPDRSYLDPIIRQGIEAFERELPRLREELLAQGYTEKEWVAFHGDKYLGHARREYDLLRRCCDEEGITEDVIFTHPLMPIVRHVKLLR